MASACRPGSACFPVLTLQLDADYRYVVPLRNKSQPGVYLGFKHGFQPVHGYVDILLQYRDKPLLTDSRFFSLEVLIDEPVGGKVVS